MSIVSNFEFPLKHDAPRNDRWISLIYSINLNIADGVGVVISVLGGHVIYALFFCL